MGKCTDETTPLLSNIPKYTFTLRQCLLAFVCFVQGVCGGAVGGYSSVVLSQLESNQDIFLSIDQISWIASIPTLAMLPMVLSSGWVLGTLGRCLTLRLVFLIAFAAWSITFFANSFEFLLVGRLIAGVFAGAAYPALVTYIGEIAHPKIRAVCLATIPLGCATGVLLTQLIGSYLHWRMVAALIAILPIHNLCVLYFIPESHIWLLNKNRIDDAERSFIWFRGFDDEAREEFDAILESIDNTVAINSSFTEKIKYCSSKAFAMPFLVTAVLYLTSEFSGDNAMVFYTSQIIKMISPDPDVQHYSNFLLNIIRVKATLTSVFLIKRCSIRKVFLITGFALAFSLANMSLFMYLRGVYPENKVFPIICVVCLFANTNFFALGLGPIPTVICGEMYPASVRDIGGALSAFLSFTSLFIIIKALPYLFILLRPEFIFLAFSCCAFTGCTIMYFVLPNTKNKTLQEIEQFYNA